MVDGASDEVLTLFLNENGRNLFRSVRLVPRLLFFRVFGERERIIDQIARDYKGERTRLRHVLRIPRRGSIAVCFTASPLNRPLSLDDMMDGVLCVNGVSYERLFISLRSRALWYFSEGLEDRQWNELEIRIYDSWGGYIEHCKRLRVVLESLEAGMILGEGWGKDFAHILMAVRVYRLRLFTFFAPKEIKGILMGLEYAADGTRLVDLDLYAGKEKISWGELNGHFPDRAVLGKTFRKNLFFRLFGNDRTCLDECERRILLLRSAGAEN